MQTEARYPDITVQLSGEDGNIFFIIGRVRRALRRHGVPDNEIEAFSHEVTNTKSYDEALQTVMRWVETR